MDWSRRVDEIAVKMGMGEWGAHFNACAPPRSPKDSGRKRGIRRELRGFYLLIPLTDPPAPSPSPRVVKLHSRYQNEGDF